MSIADIQTRMAQIQQQMNAGMAPPIDPYAASGPAQSATGSSFDSALASASASFGPSGDEVVADAKNYLGVPYLWGGTDPAKGLDCSGLVQRVYKDLGIDLPRVSTDQATQGTAVASLANAKPGDLVFWDHANVDHIGIYMGNNKMVVAPKTGDVVKVQTITETPDKIRRILPDSAGLDFNSLNAASRFSPSVASTLRPTSLSSSSAAHAGDYDSLFAAAGARYGVDPKLLSAVAKAESNYNPNAISGAGARGLMQIMPSTASGIGVDPMNPAEAVDGAARILSGNLKKFGSTELALAAYNAGAGAVTKYGGIPPFAETQNYVRKITASLNA